MQIHRGYNLHFYYYEYIWVFFVISKYFLYFPV